jgi:glyoxylase-like metal-dependent hydrolase (beta-lactamase superfamily II)
MNNPTMFKPCSVTTDTHALVSYFPIPFFGVLPVNAFLIHAAQPVLVDTGLGALKDRFMKNLRSLIALEDLRWLWLTHTDADHMGNLTQVLAEAPKARVVTTFLGMGKMALHQLPLDRVFLLNPGQSLDVGDRKLTCVKPPSYDAPETTGLFDSKTRIFFSADCFGALMKEPAVSAADIAPSDLRDGLITWATIDAPWLQTLNQREFDRSVTMVRQLGASTVLSNHLPPATGMTEVLLHYLASSRSAAPFTGPDQAALEQMFRGKSGS